MSFSNYLNKVLKDGFGSLHLGETDLLSRYDFCEIMFDDILHYKVGTKLNSGMKYGLIHYDKINKSYVKMFNCAYDEILAIKSEGFLSTNKYITFKGELIELHYSEDLITNWQSEILYYRGYELNYNLYTFFFVDSSKNSHGIILDPMVHNKYFVKYYNYHKTKPLEKLLVGNKIKYSNFGVGIIIKISGVGEERSIVVLFESNKITREFNFQELNSNNDCLLITENK